jgi:hypothetical protein
MNISPPVSDNESVDSVDSGYLDNNLDNNLDKRLPKEKKSGRKKKSRRKKKSERSSNTNRKTTYRLGRLVNDEIHADGFTMKLEQSNGAFKFVMHVTFSQNDKPICISVIEQGKRVDQWIWCDEIDINEENHTIITKQGEVLPLGERVQQEDMKTNTKARNSAIYKDINEFAVKGNAYYITSDINVGNPFRMYKKFTGKDNVNQVLGLTVAQSSKKPLGMQALDAYINNIVVKKRILTKIGQENGKAPEFERKINEERVQLKSYEYPLKS